MTTCTVLTKFYVITLAHMRLVVRFVILTRQVVIPSANGGASRPAAEFQAANTRPRLDSLPMFPVLFPPNLSLLDDR